jgi:hypothetical protein
MIRLDEGRVDEGRVDGRLVQETAFRGGDAPQPDRRRASASRISRATPLNPTGAARPPRGSRGRRGG